MRPMLILLFLSLFVSTSALAVEADDGVLTPDQVAALLSIQGKKSEVTDVVVECMNGGLTYGDCLCGKQVQVAAYNQNVADLFITYPDLATYDRVRFLSPSGAWVTLDLEGIKKQASLEPVCK